MFHCRNVKSIYATARLFRKGFEVIKEVFAYATPLVIFKHIEVLYVKRGGCARKGEQVKK